jgi:hypothetical protein
VEDKIKKLIDLHIDGAIDRGNYENKFIELNKDKERLIKETNELSLTASEEKEMKTRLKSFRKYFDANKPLKKFDADVFESIVEKIILGGIDDKGQKDPHQLTFVFKTGPKSTITMGKDDDTDKDKGFLKKGVELYSHLSLDTCGDSGATTTPEPLILLEFKHFYDFFSFSKNSENYHQKDLKKSIKIKIAI